MYINDGDKKTIENKSNAFFVYIETTWQILLPKISIFSSSSLNLYNASFEATEKLHNTFTASAILNRRWRPIWKTSEFIFAIFMYIGSVCKRRFKLAACACAACYFRGALGYCAKQGQPFAIIIFVMVVTIWRCVTSATDRNTNKIQIIHWARELISIASPTTDRSPSWPIWRTTEIVFLIIINYYE